MSNSKLINFAFFGTSEFAVYVLDELEKANLLPSLVVTMPAKPQGRKLVVTPTPVDVWATKRNIATIRPEKTRTEDFEQELRSKGNFDLFVVASYGKILPENIIYLPKHKTLNVHPSLLPLLRGAAPIERSILADMQDTGVTIMRLDKGTDSGPIVAQEKMHITPWPKDRISFEIELGNHGGKLLADVIPKWVSGKIKETEQEHSASTHAPKIEKDEALLDLKGDARTNLLKVKAFYKWPKAYFFGTDTHDNKKRVIVNDAEIKDGIFTPTKVVPEGSHEMTFTEYLRGHKY